MAMCLLCLELKRESSDDIRVKSKQWQKENIGKIIEQHFWTLKSITLNSWLCANCWEIVKTFHKFYTQIEEAHAHLSIVKVDPLEVIDNEYLETARNNELFENNLQNVQRKNIPTVISGEETEEELDIKTEIEIDEEYPSAALVVNAEIFPKTNIQTNGEDHLEELWPPVVIKTEHTIDENVIENSPENSSDFTGDCDSLTADSDIESDNRNQSTISKERRKPHPKRKEIDEFLSKHYKITCVICQTPMPTFYDLSQHFAKQHNEPAYVICCNRKYSHCSLLADHIHCHLNPDYFKCKQCGKILSDRRCVEEHAKTHSIQDKKHICEICHKGFSRKTGLNNHKLIHLPDEEKQFACEECGKLFANKNHLLHHVRVVHLNKYALVCDICGEKMRGKDVLERHILKHKGVPIPTIACDICGLKVTGQRGLRSHKNSQHPKGGKQEYPCHLCSKISPTHKAYKKHVKDKHESGYDFKCTLCEKAYKRACTLREHMATHTGTALYKCSYCHKKFNSNANMHSHRKKKHPKEWEDECRAKYSGNLPPKYKTVSSPVGSVLDSEGAEGAAFDSQPGPW